MDNNSAETNFLKKSAIQNFVKKQLKATDYSYTKNLPGKFCWFECLSIFYLLR